MPWIHEALAFLKQLTHPESLNAMAGDMGIWLYVILIAIIFCETGLVVMPFLPGDSLLFAIGAMAAIDGSPINLPLLSILLIVAAIAGDALNYTIGAKLGPAAFHKERRWLNRKHLEAAHAFYEKHGGKTIILARFVPIVRTFAPFVAGVAQMTYRSFAIYNVVGAIVWVGLLVGAGRLFGGLPWVKANFEAVIMAIIVISVLPAVIEFLRARSQARKAAAAGE